MFGDMSGATPDTSGESIESKINSASSLTDLSGASYPVHARHASATLICNGAHSYRVAHLWSPSNMSGAIATPQLTSFYCFLS